MKSLNRGIIDINKYLTITIFISIFLIPIKLLNEIGLNLDQYLFAFMILIYYLNYIFKDGKVKSKDIILLLLMIYFSFLNKSLSDFQLLGLVVIDKIINNEEKTIKNIYTSKILYISLAFVIIYTLVYFGDDGRYIFTGIREVNLGGFSLIMLFIMIRTKNKILGNILLLLGVLTFSRSYFLALIILYISEFLLRKQFFKRTIIIKILKNFKIIVAISIMVLIIFSIYFSYLYQNGELDLYEQGIKRLISFKDYSNYFRFKANTNLFQIYKSEPIKLLTGLNTDEFLYLNRKISIQTGQAYRAIKPHNYFFSYFRIYGVFSLFIFGYLSTIMKQIIRIENLPIFLVVLSYATTLGVGFSSYWLFLSVFAMIFYNKKYNWGERNE